MRKLDFLLVFWRFVLQDNQDAILHLIVFAGCGPSRIESFNCSHSKSKAEQSPLLQRVNEGDLFLTFTILTWLLTSFPSFFCWNRSGNRLGNRFMIIFMESSFGSLTEKRRGGYCRLFCDRDYKKNSKKIMMEWIHQKIEGIDVNNLAIIWFSLKSTKVYWPNLYTTGAINACAVSDHKTWVRVGMVKHDPSLRKKKVFSPVS